MSDHSEVVEDTQSPAPAMQRQNPKWVGVLIALFLPGAAHFLARQRLVGILLYLATILLSILTLFSASVPVAGFLYIAQGLFLIFILLYGGILVSSWRQTRWFGSIGWLLFFGIIVLQSFTFDLICVPILKTFVGEGYAVQSMAMAPTLIGPSTFAPEVKQSDRVFVNNWIYRFAEPERGDVTVYRAMTPEGSPTILVFRLVGLPGETIDIVTPYVLINGKRLAEPPIIAKIAAKQEGYSGYCTAEDLVGITDIPLPLTLGADEYFFLGDNTQHSKDSRFRGPVHRQDIIGRAIRIYYPLNHIGDIE